MLVLVAGNAIAVEPSQEEVSVGYNVYNGGGISVHGPAIIVRKDLVNQTSVKVGARVDLVSSASIDVVTQASSFKERRQEYTLGLSNIIDETLMQLDYTNSTESDYVSNLLSIVLAHDLFNKNMTLSMRVARSWDQVEKNGDPAFGSKDLNRTIYAFGVTQSLKPRWLVQFNYEATADQGYINNPYRSVLTLDGGTAPENYPDARTGHAWVARTTIGIPPAIDENGKAGGSSSLQLDYRYYQDTFDVHSYTAKMLYQRYVLSRWLLGFFYRYYRQGAASFYGDRLPSNQLYKARDKELSRFRDHWVGGSIKFRPKQRLWDWMEYPSVQLSYSFMLFDYDNFTDPRTGELYSQRAHVVHTSFGFRY